MAGLTACTRQMRSNAVCLTDRVAGRTPTDGQNHASWDLIACKDHVSTSGLQIPRRSVQRDRGPAAPVHPHALQFRTASRSTAQNKHAVSLDAISKYFPTLVRASPGTLASCLVALGIRAGPRRGTLPACHCQHITTMGGYSCELRAARRLRAARLATDVLLQASASKPIETGTRHRLLADRPEYISMTYTKNPMMRILDPCKLTLCSRTTPPPCFRRQNSTSKTAKSPSCGYLVKYTDVHGGGSLRRRRPHRFL
jgi:hypothetical protein